MRQVIVGVSIFVALQLVYVAVLLGMTIWEGRQLGRSMPHAPRVPVAEPVSEPLDEAA
jgi:hypothetical protein